jgi:hypothetical protein
VSSEGISRLRLCVCVRLLVPLLIGGRHREIGEVLYLPIDLAETLLVRGRAESFRLNLRVGR